MASPTAPSLPPIAPKATPTPTGPVTPTHDQVCFRPSSQYYVFEFLTPCACLGRSFVYGDPCFRLYGCMSGLHEKSSQIIVYTVVIFGVWNIPGARLLITPLKLLTIGFHELCHIAAVRPLISLPFVSLRLIRCSFMLGHTHRRVDPARLYRPFSGRCNYR
jgi:hypothetical protein